MWLKSPVLFSCKITHSIITYLDRRGEDLELLYEKCDWPAEFLRDPSCWLEADKMENILRQIDFDYGRNVQNPEGFIVAVGHQCKDLRAWGVLDSVLRMVQTPKDLFAQPERFLSYFVSPAPPVGEIRRSSDSVSFVLPVSEEQFPRVTSYLRAALEALPTYINKPMATVRWDNSRLMISWSEQQASLFGEAQNTELSLHPELVRNILLNLESSQKQLEEMKLELLEKDQEITSLKDKLAAVSIQPAQVSQEGVSAALLPQMARGLDRELSGPLSRVLNDLYRLGDYMARGQQLITLLIAQGRQTPQVQEAMRRVDWNLVSSEGPQTVKRAVGGLQEIQQTMRDLHLLANTEGKQPATFEEPAVPSDINQLVKRVVGEVKKRSASEVHIDELLLLDRPVRVNPSQIEQALSHILDNAVEAVSPQGAIRVVTRPKGARAEVEITDTGRGMDEVTLARVYEPFFTTKQGDSAGLGLSVAHSIIRTHSGSMAITSQPGAGSTVLIDLPLDLS